MKTLKHKLHVLAITNGWYRVITKGLPLDVCKTVFGVYCLEGYYTPQTQVSIMMELYDWGLYDRSGVRRDTFDDELDWERRTNL